MSRYRVAADSVNLRQNPSLAASPTGYLQKGDLVKVLGKSDDLYWYEVETESGDTGWASHKFLNSVEHDGEIEAGDPPWLAIARSELGVKEFPGPADNPRIQAYHLSTTLPPRVAMQDETPWCSSFVNWCFEKAGYEGTDMALARSWLNWGIKLESPRTGCVVVFSRPRGGPSAGHVAFYIGATTRNIRVLGGNQGDAVSITGFPKSRLLGYRWPG